MLTTPHGNYKPKCKYLKWFVWCGGIEILRDDVVAFSRLWSPNESKRRSVVGDLWRELALNRRASYEHYPNKQIIHSRCVHKGKGFGIVKDHIENNTICVMSGPIWRRNKVHQDTCSVKWSKSACKYANHDWNDANKRGRSHENKAP